MPKENNDKIWATSESDIVETTEVFSKDIERLIKKINTYWYAGDAKRQSINVLKQVLERKLRV